MGLKKFSDIFEKTKDTNDPKYQGFNFLSLIEKWPSIVGERLALHTHPLKEIRGVLTILTDHPVISDQLSFMSMQLIKRIGDDIPVLKNKFKSINYQVNPTFFTLTKKKSEKFIKKTSKETFHPYCPKFNKLKKEAEQNFEHIEDQEIKELLCSIYVQGFYEQD